MSCEPWHPLDGNMITLERQKESAAQQDDDPKCPSCGEELEFDDDDFAYCPVCGWEE